jgi:hypothetical protein
VAGYSQRTLCQKLGIKPGVHAIVLGGPGTYGALLGELPRGATLSSRLAARSEFIHQFARRQSRLRADLPRLAAALADHGMLWISWPKKASGVETDLDENVIRELGLAEGLVDVKVCAVDDVWSGLKFVRRLQNRRQPQ